MGAVGSLRRANRATAGGCLHAGDDRGDAAASLRSEERDGGVEADRSDVRRSVESRSSPGVAAIGS